MLSRAITSILFRLVKLIFTPQRIILLVSGKHLKYCTYSTTHNKGNYLFKPQRKRSPPPTSKRRTKKVNTQHKKTKKKKNSVG